MGGREREREREREKRREERERERERRVCCYSSMCGRGWGLASRLNTLGIFYSHPSLSLSLSPPLVYL